MIFNKTVEQQVDAIIKEQTDKILKSVAKGIYTADQFILAATIKENIASDEVVEQVIFHKLELEKKLKAYEDNQSSENVFYLEKALRNHGSPLESIMDRCIDTIKARHNKECKNNDHVH